MNTFEKGNNYRAMVIDLARMYQQSAMLGFRNTLAHDVLVAIHEGALDTDTSRFTVDLNSTDLTFNNADDGSGIMVSWVHVRGNNLADELEARIGAPIEEMVLIDHTQITRVVEMLGNYQPIAHALHRLATDKKTSIVTREFRESIVFTLERKDETPVVVGFFKNV